MSALHKLAAGRKKKKKKRARGGISETVQIKVDLLSWDIFKNIIESVIYTLSIFQGFNRILSKSFIQIVNFGLK